MKQRGNNGQSIGNVMKGYRIWRTSLGQMREVHAVGMASTERLKLSRQMAVVGGKIARFRCLCSWRPLVLRWRKAGCRRNSSTSGGRMKVGAKLVTRRKAQKITGSTIAQNGTKEGAKSENLRKGVEVAKRYCNASSQ